MSENNNRNNIWKKVANEFCEEDDGIFITTDDVENKNDNDMVKITRIIMNTIFWVVLMFLVWDCNIKRDRQETERARLESGQTSVQ
jgi:hypothetical protein